MKFDVLVAHAALLRQRWIDYVCSKGFLSAELQAATYVLFRRLVSRLQADHTVCL